MSSSEASLIVELESTKKALSDACAERDLYRSSLEKYLVEKTLLDRPLLDRWAQANWKRFERGEAGIPIDDLLRDLTGVESDPRE